MQRSYLIVALTGLFVGACADKVIINNNLVAPDEDGDGVSSLTKEEAQKMGFATIGAELKFGDCDDNPLTGANVNPGADEVCDGIDNDCDGLKDEADDDLVACDDGNECTTELCTSGSCNSTIINCDDGNLCTNDGCNTATGCTHGTVDCNDLDVCTTDSCNPLTGCTTAPNTAQCDDSNLCTTDLCNSLTGGCSHMATTCDDGDACTDDSCNPASGCAHAPNSNATCDDNDGCTTDDACFDGDCIGGAQLVCDDGDTCFDDACVDGSCVQGSPIACDDGDACTADGCNPTSGCTNTPVACNDGNVCTTDSCDEVTGCVFSNNTMTCTDGNACTDGDFCLNGGCVSGSPMECFDNDLCTTDSCNMVTGCVYTSTVAACNDNNNCTDDWCDPSLGCVNDNNTIACNDGNACTVGDACSDGMCAGTTANCDDGNLCTVDSCDPDTGCENAAMPNCCTNNAECDASVPAGLPANYNWGCIDETGATASTCSSCLDADNDDYCDTPMEEVCDNGFDEDGNGMVDCADSDCTNDPACVIPCAPACGGKQCGDDGCGGSCGTCQAGDKCNTSTSMCELEPRLSITWTSGPGVPQNAGGQLVLLAKCYDASGALVADWGVKAYGPTDVTMLTWTDTEWYEPADCRAQVVEVVNGETVWYANGLTGWLSYVWDGLTVTKVKGNGTTGWPFWPWTDSDGDGMLDPMDMCPYDGYNTSGCAVP